MPAKPKISKEMIVDAAFEIARKEGMENINARTVSEKLNCSTQPVMYHFATIEELKKTAYAKADRYHSEYLMNVESPQKGVMLGIGLNYIRFAMEEPHLFRFLFQSNFLFAHGYASIIANNSLEYEEELIKAHLKRAYAGAVLAAQKETR